jgi:HAD superfamily hydrolase (TIGR01490 family)
MAPCPFTRAAFFDVDETLIAVKSMFRFLSHHLSARGEPPSAYAAVVADLRGLVRAGASRAEVTRAYYRTYAGLNTAELAAQGREWFEREQRAGGLFLPHGLAAFHEHRRSGALTVLVSGSFAPCLDPIAAWLGASMVFGAQPETLHGVCTGGLTTAMLDDDKAAAARSVMRTHAIPAADCYAYGDHVSDLPLLLAVGHPVVVGSDPDLVDHPAASGWPRLPGVDRGAALQVE